MNIEIEKLRTLWYENECGQVEDVKIKDLPGAHDSSFIYQHSQFPNELSHRVFRSVVEKEVESCEHPSECVQKTHGWIDGVEGRECNKCHGLQTKKVEEKWPEKWDAYGAREVCCGRSSWSEDLVLAMANSKDYSLSQSILIAANACSRCMNSLAHKYGLSWGYKEKSPEWEKTNTECDFCKEL